MVLVCLLLHLSMVFSIPQSSLRALGEVCVTEVVVRSIRGAGQLPEQLEGRALLLHDLHQLLIAVALKALATHHGMQVNLS